MTQTTQPANTPNTPVTIDGQALNFADVLAVARHYAPVALGNEVLQLIQTVRAVINKISAEGQKVYGVTTGFGHLSSIRIPQQQLIELQHNLLRSHAAGVGDPLAEEVTRAMMLLLAASLARGHSGVRVEVVQLLNVCANTCPCWYKTVCWHLILLNAQNVSRETLDCYVPRERTLEVCYKTCSRTHFIISCWSSKVALETDVLQLSLCR
jgi:Aromatic amino acid lyase